MTYRIQDAALEEEYERYIAVTKSTKVGLLNFLIELFLHVGTPFSPNREDNLTEMCSFFDSVDWDRVNKILSKLKKQPLTKDILLKNVLLDLVERGLEAYDRSE